MIIKYLIIFVFVRSAISANRFRCDYQYIDGARGWFKFHRFPTTWLDAKLRCMLEGARLASPTTDTLDAMMFVMNNSNVEKVFTGINSLIRKGYFNTLEGVSAEHSSVLQLWSKGEPNNLNDNERCVSLDGTGRLADVNCDTMLPYICYRKKTGIEKWNVCKTIDKEYKFDIDSLSCHKVHIEKRNFSESFMTCQAEGGHLAIVNSDEEADAIKNVIDNSFPDSIQIDPTRDFFFLGFHDIWYKDRNFRTIQDQTLEESGGVFGENQPDNYNRLGEYCGGIHRLTSELHDLVCSIPHGFVCEISPAGAC